MSNPVLLLFRFQTALVHLRLQRVICSQSVRGLDGIPRKKGPMIGKKKQLASNTDPTESKNVPSQSSPVMAPFTLSSSSYPSFFYNAGSTSSAFVPRYYQNNHTLYSLPTQNDSEDARPPNGHFQPTSLIDDVDWFNNQSLSPDRVRLLCLAANFLKGRRVKEKLGVATSARETNTRVFAPESCTGMASSGLRFSNRANMVACHC